MGKKARHSRSVSWHPAWRADSDSSDSEGDAAPSSSSIARRRTAGQGAPALQPVLEEGIDDRSRSQQQQHQQHQQAHSEPQPRQPSARATAMAAETGKATPIYANVAVDTNSISSPVSLSPYASQNTSGLHVQSGSMTFDQDTYGGNASYAQYHDGEKDSRDHNGAHVNHAAHAAHDDDYECYDGEGDDGEFPDTIVIEEDALSPPLDMSDPATDRFDYRMMHHRDNTFVSSAGPHANPDNSYASTSEGAGNNSVGQADRPFPNRADTAQFFHREDILSRTTSFPMATSYDQQDAGAHDQAFFDNFNEGQHTSWSQNTMETERRNSNNNNSFGDGDAGSFFEELGSTQEQNQTSQPAPMQEEDSSYSYQNQSSFDPTNHQPAPEIIQPGSMQPITETTVSRTSPDHNINNLMVPEQAENEDNDTDMDDRLSTQSKPMYDATENDARYDEGLPLINEPQDNQPRGRSGLTASALKKHNRTISSIFAMDEPAEGEDFFKAVLTNKNGNGPSRNEGGFVPHALKRKSTLDVIGSMSFDHGKEAVESPFMEAIAEDPELPQEEGDEPQTNAPEPDRAPAEPREEDLAEKWKAMGFDDDELLGAEDSVLEPPIDASATPAVPVQKFTPTPTPGTGINDYFGDTANHMGASYHAALPQVQRQTLPKETIYTPHQPSTADLVTGLEGLNLTSEPAIPFMSPGATDYVPAVQQVQENLKPSSFTDSKESYKSPYDLPEDLTRQTRRHPHPVAPKVPAPIPYSVPQSSVAPPPRRSSLQNEASQDSVPPPPRPSTQSPKPQPPPKTNQTSNFFEELPAVAPRSRSRPRVQKAYTPAAQAVPPPPVPKLPSMAVVQPPPPPPPVQNPYNISSSPRSNSPLSNGTAPLPYGLQGPGPVDPYIPNSSGTATAPPVAAPPKTAVRYSPKPPNVPAGITPPATRRYSPAPQTAPSQVRYAPIAPRESSLSPPPKPILPFQPRTSSPLASNEPTSESFENVDSTILPPIPTSSSAPPPRGPSHDRPSIPGPSPPAQPPALGYTGGHSFTASDPSTTHHRYEPIESHEIGPPQPAMPTVPNPYAPSSTAQMYTPHAVSTSVPPMPTSDDVNQARTAYHQRPGPPPRSMTQSPGKGGQAQALRAAMQSPPRTAPPPSVTMSSMLSPNSRQSKTALPELDLVPPTDGREMDPLQRWKGCPIFKFGFNDTAVSTFPKHVPRYTSGHMVPKIMPTVGELRIRHARPLISPDETLDKERRKYPGPLRAKSKKKDLIAWLSSMIALFENAEHDHANESAVERDEKLILWKLVRILVENDGSLGGNETCEASIRSILSPNQTPRLDQAQSVEPKITNTTFPPEIMDMLMTGQREKAVWQAVDNNLWGHAMLLSSTLENTSIWRQVASEFIRKEIVPLGESGKSLAAAYEVFAGNTEEAVDHLVPPSARAGLHMVSKDMANPGTTGSGFEGLEKWRETVQIILSNRTPNDSHALRSLSQLLASSGRVSASHVCALLASGPAQRVGPAASIAGGVDDPNAMFVLLGWDHRRHASAINGDTDAICLTEAFEFATSILAGEPTHILPHLQAFKLHHAICLAECGQIAEAQQYCEALASTFKPSTKPSPYYNPAVLSQLENLMKRLEQFSVATGSSWISKPNMNKVSDSVWAKFSSFVAGEDSEGAGSGNTANQAPGPFANVLSTMSTPNLANMSKDTYVPHVRPPSVPMSSTASRYANVQSSGPYVPQSPSSNRSSLDSQRPVNMYGGYPASRSHSYERQAPAGNENYPPSQYGPYVPNLNTSGHLLPDNSMGMAHTPLSPVVENQTEAQARSLGNNASNAAAGPASTGLYAQPMQSYGTLIAGNTPSPMAPSPYSNLSETSTYQAPEGNTGYVPPSYEPPTYEPPSDGRVDLGSSSESGEEAPKPKRSIMDDDDDDDILSRAEAVKREEKARHDREAAERVRKAAEEDAKRNEAKSQKKGWFTGWFAKKQNEDNGGTTVVRAKLGEESSFYYDKELKRWVNKKDPNSAKPAASSLPPPPKAAGPPKSSTPVSQASPAHSASASPLPPPPPVPGVMLSRPPSDFRPPPGGPATQTAPPPMAPPSSTAPLAKPPSGAAPPAAPPKPQPLGNGSSIDDLLGAPAPRAHTGRSKKKGRGYVDIMAK